MTVLAGRETRPGVTGAGPGERRGWLGVLVVTAAVLDLRRVPAWLPDPIPSPPVAQTGRYTLFRVAELRELAGPEGI